MGDLSEQTTARGTRPGQRVKIHVDQAGESESVGGGKVRS